MTFFKSLIFFILQYLLFLVLIFVMKLTGIINDYVSGLGLYWIPTLISLFIFTLIFFASLKKGENRPRAAFFVGFVWLILTIAADIILLSTQVQTFSIIEYSEGLINNFLLVFDNISIDNLFSQNLFNTIIRYIIVFFGPFLLSLFLPKPDLDINLPQKSNK